MSNPIQNLINRVEGVQQGAPKFTAHTSGMLALHSPHATTVVCGGSPKVQVFKAQGYPGSGYFPSPSEARANARRLVACWNACEGMSTESLEAMPAHFFGAVGIERKTRVEQERNQLLFAIEQALEAEGDVFAPMVATILRQARDKVLGA